MGYRMSLLWSSEELHKVLKADSGFKEILASFPQADRDFIAKILEDPASLGNLLNLLPSQLKETTQSKLSQLVETPQKALDLFEQCRFFEARELLKNTIDLYGSSVNTPYDALNQATSFVSNRLQALCLCLLGEVEWELGNSEKSGGIFQQALEKAEELGDQATVAKASHGLGNYLWQIAELEPGINHCLRALELLENHEDQWKTTGRILSSLSNMYEDIGQYDVALEYAEQAIDLCIQVKDQQTLPLALNSRALLLTGLDEHEQAINDLDQALEISHENGNIRQEALLLNNLAMCLLHESTHQPSLEIASTHLANALEKSRQTHSQSLLALITGNFGIIHQLHGQTVEAENMFRKAAELYQQIGAKSSEAAALTQLGNHLNYHVGDIKNAQSAYRDAIELTERTRSKLSHENYRMGFTQETIEPYWMLIDSLVISGAADAAVTYVERAKSRSMLEFMSQPFCNSRDNSKDCDDLQQTTKLLLEKEEIEKTLSAQQKKEEKGIEDHHERGTCEKYENNREILLTQLAEKELFFGKACNQLRITDPESASLIEVSPLTAEEIKRTLDKDTCFLELFQGVDVLNIFVVTAESVDSIQVDLPASEAQIILQQLLTDLRSDVTRDVRSHDYIRSVRQPLAFLYDHLIRPILPHLKGYRRLIISPHLFWHYLPFQALFDQEKKEFLCDQYEIGYSPSASILQLCQKKNLLKKDTAIIFSRDNGDLPYVSQEGALLAGAFYPSGELFTEDNAHLGQIQKKSSSVDVIHFACHGYFNQEQPLLSGIDIPPDTNEERGTFLFDFFNMNLDSSLITLSACDSGLSHFTSADELVGLSRGLFYAGAAATLLSLWQVADPSTCLLMENFYWQYTQKNKTKTESLKLAMQAVKSEAGYSHPYYWAPFVVMGDWR